MKHKSELIPVSSGTFESFDGTSIYYESRGHGEPIVLVYGIACQMNHFHYQVEHFSKTHQVIIFDIRGHHLSEIPRDPENLSLSAIGMDLSYLLRTLGLKQAHFIGHSFGVPAMLSAYHNSPAIFKSLTFINGFAKNPIKGMFGLDLVEPFFHFINSRYKENPVLCSSLWRTITDSQLTAWLTGIAGGFNLKVAHFKDVEIYTKGVSQVPLNVFLPLFENMMTFDGMDIASKIEKPVLVMSGDHDLVTPQKFQHELHHMISGSEFISIAYGSHCCQLDFPDYVNLKIGEFLSSYL
jgi:pimeloyl-ACP methyl ester carboxylesterase